jgi:sugar phosphate isomerase/epimerase
MNDIYLSFFMFTTNLRPDDYSCLEVVIEHIRRLEEYGYSGFEFPIPPPKEPEDFDKDLRDFDKDLRDFDKDLRDYENLRDEMDSRGLRHIKIATNVGATPRFDPTSYDYQQQEEALEYLKSRVDITAALRGEIMMGPIILPYGYDAHASIWSDELQNELQRRYMNAQPILNELGYYAESRNVKLAIEPITHWETPGPNKLSQLMEFLDGIDSRQVGVVIDSAHETLDGDGPEIFRTQVETLADQGRLHYIQISPPDRGAVHTSWLPWQSFLEPILPRYHGPIAIEIFNAIPEFVNSLRLTRRKFWIPGEDEPNEYPSAYDIAALAIETTRTELDKCRYY